MEIVLSIEYKSLYNVSGEKFHICNDNILGSMFEGVSKVANTSHPLTNVSTEFGLEFCI